MANTSLTEICDWMATTVAAATGLVRTENPGQIRDGINDWPVMQFYPDSGGQDPGGRTDRTTFGAGVRQSNVVVIGDLYAKQRGEVGEDMAALLPVLDAVILVLEQEDSQPFFGVAGIQQFLWSWRRVTFEYGDKGDTKYLGARFTFELRLY